MSFMLYAVLGLIVGSAITYVILRKKLEINNSQESEYVLKLQYKENELGSLKNNLVQTHDQLQEKTTMLDNTLEENKKMKRELQRLQNVEDKLKAEATKTTELTDKNTSLYEELLQTKRDLEEKMSTNNSLIKESEKLQKEITSMQKQLGDKFTIFQDLERQEKDNAILKDQIDELTLQLNTIQRDFESEKSLSHELSYKLKEKTDAMLTLQSAFDGLTAQIASTNKKVADYAKVEVYKSELVQLDNEIVMLKEIIDKKNHEISLLNSDLNFSRKDFNRVETENKKLTIKLNDREYFIEKTRENLIGLETELASLNSKLVIKIQEKDELMKQADKANNQIKELQTNLVSKDMQLRQLQNEIKDKIEYMMKTKKDIV